MLRHGNRADAFITSLTDDSCRACDTHTDSRFDAAPKRGVGSPGQGSRSSSFFRWRACAGAPRRSAARHPTIGVTGGDVFVHGGAGSGGGNSAQIYTQGFGGQSIVLAGGGLIDITGGTVGARNSAKIQSENGNQSISGATSISLTGGASGGGLSNGNSAFINDVELLFAFSADHALLQRAQGGHRAVFGDREAGHGRRNCHDRLLTLCR